MKKNIATIVATLVLGAVLVLSGCASTQTGTERGQTVSGTMETVESDIRIVVIGINSAGRYLAALINPNQTDSATAFDSYSASVDALAKSSEAYIEHSDRMGVEGRDYFDEWQVQGTRYVNPRIRALSDQRRRELSTVYADIATTSVGVQGSLETHVSTLQEIRTYFSTDLTPRGVQVMTPLALDAIADGHALTISFEDVLGSISAVRYELASSDAE